MDNSWYTSLTQVPQFGYAVDLAAFYYESGPGEAIVLVSAPGNPSLKVPDPGFIEWQQLNRTG